MAVERELFREVLGADSQRLREAASQNRAVAKRDGGGRFAERSHCSSLSARTCAPTFRKNDPNRVHRGTSPLYAPANCSAPIRDALSRTGATGARNRAAYPTPMVLWPKPLDLRLERGFDR